MTDADSLADPAVLDSRRSSGSGSENLRAHHDDVRRLLQAHEIDAILEDPLREADLVGYYRTEDLAGTGDEPENTQIDAIMRRPHAPEIQAPIGDARRGADLFGYLHAGDRTELRDEAKAPHDDTSMFHWASQESGFTLESSPPVAAPIARSHDGFEQQGEGTALGGKEASNLIPPSDSAGRALEAPVVSSDVLSDWIDRARMIGPTGLWLAYALRQARNDPSRIHLQRCHQAAKYVALCASGEEAHVAQTLFDEIATVFASSA